MKKDLALEIGFNQEEHSEMPGSEKKILLFRPYMRFISGQPEDVRAFRCTFDGDALFTTEKHAVDYMKDVLSVLTKPMTAYTNLAERDRPRGKT